MTADPPEPARREHPAAGDPPAPGSASCGSCRALPAFSFAITRRAVLTDFPSTGKWTSRFRPVAPGIVVLRFVLRKDALSLASRP